MKPQIVKSLAPEQASEEVKDFFPDLRPNTACDYHRIVLPNEFLNVKTRNPVFWCNRMATGGYLELTRLKKLGYKIVVDMDDLHLLDESHYLYPVMKRSGISEVQSLCMQAADVLIVTTPHLASRLRDYNKNIVVIPNALPFDEGQFARSQDKSSGSSFIWAGGASHRHDLALLPNRADITIGGVRFDDNEWKVILDGLRGRQIKAALPLSNYMNIYDGHQCSLAPLVDSGFNRCKSNLKMLEAGAKGLAFIASGVRPYYNEVDCDIVKYANTPGEFDRIMTDLKNSPNMLEDYQEKLAEHVRKNYHLKDANELRRQLFESF